MSARQILNCCVGSLVVLFLGAAGMVFHTLEQQDADSTRLTLAIRQEMLVQNMTREAVALAQADDVEAVNGWRERLGKSILLFDQTLTAMQRGGTALDDEGVKIELEPAGDADVRQALGTGAEIWFEIGMPLADLAAGEFSPYSNAGMSAVQRLQDVNLELLAAMGDVVTALGNQAGAQRSLLRFAQAAAGMVAVLLAGVAFLYGRFNRNSTTTAAAPPRPVVATNTARDDDPGSAAAEPESLRQQTSPASLQPTPPSTTYTGPVDLENASASVDQLAVDMTTIATSTDKMKLAIDSIGTALAGMLFSLNEMAQDTAEGHKVTRNANNAASYTATAATDLADSAREMGRVVGRVSQLAQKTRQVAQQITTEAAHIGEPGRGFTSVVAAEVKGLAAQTSSATSQIEQTVSEILGTSRQYEDAIGQIIKNIAAINKVSVHLGELMIDPPTTVVPGTPMPAAAPQAAVAPAPQPAAPPPAQPVEQPVAQPVAQAAPEPAAVASQAPAATAPATETMQAPAPEPAPPEPAPLEPATPETAELDALDDELIGGEPPADELASDDDLDPSELAAQATDLIEELSDVTSDSDLDAAETDTNADIDNAPAAAAPEPADSDDDDGSNVFMLNKPPKQAYPAPAAEQEQPSPAPAPAEGNTSDDDDDGSSNVFMLNMPKKKAAPEPSADAPVDAPAGTADDAVADSADVATDDTPDEVDATDVPDVTDATDATDTSDAPAKPSDSGVEVDAKPSSNVFMLNMPKKK